MTPEQAKTALDKIRALVTTVDDSPEGQMGPRWVLGHVREILDGPDTEPRAPGCECQLEAGDSPCRVHGDDDHPQTTALKPQTTALEDLRTAARGNPVLLAFVQAQTVGDLYPGASILLPVSEDVLDAAARIRGAYEYRSEVTRTVTLEEDTFELTFHSIEQASQPKITPTRKLYLEIGPRADVMHAIEVKNGITEAWRETRRQVTAERAAGVRLDRIERIAEALYDAGWLRAEDPQRAADALSWLNGANITSAEAHKAAYAARYLAWRPERQVKMIPILRSGEVADDGTPIRFEWKNIN